MNDNLLPVITVIVPGDLHLTEPGLPNHQVAQWVVDQANHLVHPDFVQFIGDNVQDATAAQFELFRELVDRLEAPWYALVGDHDIDAARSLRLYQATVGDDWGGFSLGGYRFLRLNTQEARPVGLSTQQLDWLSEELRKARQSGERVVVFQHNYPYQIWEDFAGPGIDEWRILLQPHSLEAVISGHTHYWQIANNGKDVHIALRSIGDPEGGAAGYLVTCFQGSRFGLTYRTPDDHGPIVVILAPRATLLCTRSDHVTTARSEIVTRVWSEQDVISVEASLDGGEPFPLQKGPQECWSAPFDATTLTKGNHQLTVRATSQSGASGEQTIAFPVDPTGRYTAVPCTFPPVISTNFC